MSKILAIDTSTLACSAALLLDHEVQETFTLAPQLHTQFILPMIDQLLSENKLSLAQLSALAFSCGPGSFTGIRIGAGIIQGLALGANLPVIPVSTLQTLAQGAYREYQAAHVLPSLDAQRNEVYWGVYSVKNHLLIGEVEDCLCKPEEILIPENYQWVGVGDGWKNYAKIFQAQLGKKLQSFHVDFLPHAQDVAKIAQHVFLKGEYVTAEHALPIYLRGKNAWKKN